MKMIARIPAVIWVLVIGVVVISAALLLKPKPHVRPPKEVQLPEVTVVMANPLRQAVNVNTQGNVEPRRQIDVVSQVSGTVVQVSPQFASGGFFAKGSELIQIDARDYQVMLARATAAAQEAKKLLASERGLARQAAREWRDLGNADANDLFLRKPQIAAAEAQVVAAEAELKQAQLNIERTHITLPFAGRVRNTMVDLGQFVGVGTKIATVYDAAAALVRLPLTDQQASLINLPLAFGKPQKDLPQVVLRGVVAGTPYEWRGVITRTEASLDPQSRMYYAVVEIPDPFDPFKNKLPLIMGMYVEAEIIGKPIDDVVQLPKTAVFRRDKIYSIDTDSRVQEKTVKILRMDDNTVWVQGDIRKDEPIVLDRQGYLILGSKVRVAAPTEIKHTSVQDVPVKNALVQDALKESAATTGAAQ